MHNWSFLKTKFIISDAPRETQRVTRSALGRRCQRQQPQPSAALGRKPPPRYPQSPCRPACGNGSPAKFIISNTEFLVFNTEFLVLNTNIHQFYWPLHSPGGMICFPRTNRRHQTRSCGVSTLTLRSPCGIHHIKYTIPRFLVHNSSCLMQTFIIFAHVSKVCTFCSSSAPGLDVVSTPGNIYA